MQARESLRPRYGWSPWLAIGLGLVAVTLSLKALTRFPVGDWLVGGVLLMAVIVLARAFLHGAPVEISEVVPRQSGWVLRVPSPPGVLLGLAAMATLIAMVRRWEVEKAPAGLGVVLPWLAGLALFAAAAWWPSTFARRKLPSGRDLGRMVRPHRAWSPWVGLTVLAGGTRLVMLDRYPAFINGDEGQYLMMAVGIREGTIGNLFGTGWLDVPLLYPAAVGWLAGMAGGDLAAHRLLGGVVGTIGVLATWRLGRWIVGPWPALVGATLMAVLPFHLLFSRSAMNHVLDSTSLTLALLFLWRGIAFGRRGEVFLAGVFVGIGWYGYWGARSYPLVLALLLLVAMVDRRVNLRDAAYLGLWSAIGFVATTAPLLMTFLMQPVVFRSRLETTSIRSGQGGQGDWLEMLRQYGDQVREAILLPVIENRWLFYLHDAPFLGWPMAWLLVVGAASWLAVGVRARQWSAMAWLVVPVLVLTLGVALSTPVQSQRLVGLVSIWMLLAGCGLVAVVRWITALRVLDRNSTRWLLIAGAVAVLSVSNLAWMTAQERQLDTWGDRRALSAWDIGWRLSQGVPGVSPTVLFAGAPVMFIDDWGSVSFLAPEAEVVDLEDTSIGDSGLSNLPPDAVLVLVAERSGEQCAVEARFPDATVAVVTAHTSEVLYLVFFRGDLPGWSTATTPEGTTLAVLTDTPCP